MIPSSPYRTGGNFLPLTTAAGDSYAAGFIYGLDKGYDLARCGRIASLVSAEVVQVTGSTIPADRWARLMDNLAKE